MEPEPTEKLDRWLAEIGPATGLTTLSDLIQHPAVRAHEAERIRRAAKLIGMSRATFWRKQFGI